MERRGPVGWLINNRPRPAQRHEQHHARRVRRGLERARRRPRGPRDRPHRRGAAFQTGVDVAEIASDGIGMERYRESIEELDMHFTAWHQGVTKPVITAVNGICAGGAFHWVADADIVHRRVRRPVLRPARVGRPGGVARGHRPDPQDAGRGGHAHGARRPVRADAGRPGLRAGHDQRGGRPARAAAGAAQELAETIAKNSPAAMAATKRALWGALELGLTDACKAGPRSWCRCGATPTRPRARWPSPRSASRCGSRPPTGRSGRDLADLLFARPPVPIPTHPLVHAGGVVATRGRRCARGPTAVAAALAAAGVRPARRSA